jgi:hypothetical protein
VLRFDFRECRADIDARLRTPKSKTAQCWSMTIQSIQRLNNATVVGVADSRASPNLALSRAENGEQKTMKTIDLFLFALFALSAETLPCCKS